MSKRRQQYEQGINRLCEFLDILLKEGATPTADEIQAELDAIGPLRPVQVSLHFPKTAVELAEGFFFLMMEQYTRYDDIIPTQVQIHALPAAMDNTKSIDQFTMSDV